MLTTWLNDDTITLRSKVEDWPQALELCAKPLLDAGAIAPGYVQTIVEQHRQMGAYYVISPGLAMPHARPDEGAKGLGLSLLVLESGVAFGAGDFDPVDVIVMLAAPDENSHIAMISSLAELFSSEWDMAKLRRAKTVEEIKAIIARY